MGKPIKKIFTIDYTDSGAPRVLKAQIGSGLRKRSFTLKGECLRCGRCCARMNCEHLTKDGDKAACGLGWLMPFGCRLYPQPGEETLIGCGLYWE